MQEKVKERTSLSPETEGRSCRGNRSPHARPGGKKAKSSNVPLYLKKIKMSFNHPPWPNKGVGGEIRVGGGVGGSSTSSQFTRFGG